MAEDEYVPPRVAQEARLLGEAAGVEPVIAPLRSRVWQITLATDRLELVLGLKVAPNGRTQWHSGSISRDGEPCEEITGYDHPQEEKLAAVADFFRYPDGKPPEPLPLPVRPRSIAEAPFPIQKMWRGVPDKLGVVVGVVSGSTWRLGFDVPELDLTYRMDVTPRGPGRWFIGPIQIIREGVEDRVSEVERLDAAVRKMTAALTPPQVPTSAEPDGTPRGPAQPDAPESRKGTVLRL